MKSVSEMSDLNERNIVDELHLAVDEIHLRTRKDPRAIYLGRRQMALLSAAVVRLLVMPLSPIESSPSTRLWIFGVPVFVVDAEDHFNVGI